MQLNSGIWWLLFSCIGFALAACQPAGSSSGSDSTGTTDGTPVTLADLEGTWAGVMVTNYLCEGIPASIELSISDGTLAITGGDEYSFDIDDAGTIRQTDGQSFAVEMNLDGGVPGQFYVDAEAGFAMWANSSSSESGYGYVGLLQKGALEGHSYSETDAVGSWSGIAVRLDNSLAVTSSSTSMATIANTDGLEMSGSDGDGDFSASAAGLGLYDSDLGTWQSGDNSINKVTWSEETMNALYVMSYDKTMLGIGFLTSLCSSSIFTNLANQKFALWERQ